MATEYLLYSNAVEEEDIKHEHTGNNFLALVQSNRVRYFAEQLYREFESMIEKYDCDIITSVLPIIVRILDELDRTIVQNRERKLEVEVLKEEKRMLAQQFEKEKRKRKNSEEKMIEMECANEDLKCIQKELAQLRSKCTLLNQRIDNVYECAIHLDEALSELQENSGVNLQRNEIIKPQLNETSYVELIDFTEFGGVRKEYENSVDFEFSLTAPMSLCDNEKTSAESSLQSFDFLKDKEAWQCGNDEQFKRDNSLDPVQNKDVEEDEIPINSSTIERSYSHTYQKMHTEGSNDHQSIRNSNSETKESPGSRKTLEDSRQLIQGDSASKGEGTLNIGDIFSKATSAMKYLTAAGNISDFINNFKKDYNENTFGFTTKQLLDTMEKLEAEIGDIKCLLKMKSDTNIKDSTIESCAVEEKQRKLEKQQFEVEATNLLHLVQAQQCKYYVKPKAQGFSIRKLFDKLYQSNRIHLSREGNVSLFNVKPMQINCKQIFFHDNKSSLRWSLSKLKFPSKENENCLRRLTDKCPLIAYHLPLNNEDFTWKLQCASGVNFNVERLNLNGKTVRRDSFYLTSKPVPISKSSLLWLCERNSSGSKISILDGLNPYNVINTFLLSNSQINCIASAPAIDYQDDSETYSSHLLNRFEESRFLEKEWTNLPTMWIGCEDGSIYVYRISKKPKGTRFVTLESAVLCILYANGKLLIGRKDGKLNVFERNMSGEWDANLLGFKIMNDTHHPISRLIVACSHVWCSSFNNVYIIDVVTCRIQDIIGTTQYQKKGIQEMEGLNSIVAVSFQMDTLIQLYHAKMRCLLQEIDIKTILYKVPKIHGLFDSMNLMHVTSLLTIKSHIWIGMANGSIMIIPIHDTKEMINVPYCKVADSQLCTSRHRSEVKFFVSISDGDDKSEIEDARLYRSRSSLEQREETKSSFVVSGGSGFIELSRGDRKRDRFPKHQELKETSGFGNYVIAWKL